MYILNINHVASLSELILHEEHRSCSKLSIHFTYWCDFFGIYVQSFILITVGDSILIWKIPGLSYLSKRKSQRLRIEHKKKFFFPLQLAGTLIAAQVWIINRPLTIFYTCKRNLKVCRILLFKTYYITVALPVLKILWLYTMICDFHYRHLQDLRPAVKATVYYASLYAFKGEI